MNIFYQTLNKYTSTMDIQLGLCCMNTVLRQQKPPVFSSRKMIIKSIQEKGIDTLKEKIVQNLKDTLTLMDWNEQHGIKVFRLSSELFPHKSNPKVEDYSFDFAIPYLKEIGRKSKQYGQRLTFHPGQYNVVGTPDEKTFLQTCEDLKYHADVLDLMELDQHSVIVVHGGGIYGDKEKTIDRWSRQYHRLPLNVQKRLVIENCEKCFSIKDCLKIAIKVNIPIVFDTHHFACYQQLHPDETFHPPEFYIKHLLPFWIRRNIKPKCHVSEQGSGRTGHHSDYVETLPPYLLDIPSRYNTSIDIMIEAKAKEQALFHLYKKYPHLNPLTKPVVLTRPGAGWTNAQPNCECGC